jgi:DNA-binding NarL/FixJ family response regulator
MNDVTVTNSLNLQGRPAAGIKSTDDSRVSFVILDDHPVISFGVSRVIQSQRGWNIIGHAETPAAAREIIRNHVPDVLILDLILPGNSGLEFLHWLHAEHPAVIAIAYSVQPEPVFGPACIRAGASAYVGKHASVDVLLQSIRMAIAGDVVIGGMPLIEQTSANGRREDAADKTTLLSAREHEVLQLLADGMSTREIATTLYRSPKTIETHRARIMRKLRLRDGISLVRYAVQWRQVTQTRSGDATSVVTVPQPQENGTDALKTGSPATASE